MVTRGRHSGRGDPAGAARAGRSGRAEHAGRAHPAGRVGRAGRGPSGLTTALSGRWLPAAALFGALFGAGIATLYGGLHGAPAPPAPRPATGTVLESGPCAVPGARDTVVFVVDGRSYQLPLDACGNQPGILLDVELVTAADGRPAARLAGAGAVPGDLVAERVGALLLALAGAAGALLSALVSPTVVQARQRRRDGPASPPPRRWVDPFSGDGSGLVVPEYDDVAFPR